METLTLQIFLDAKWHDIASISFSSSPDLKYSIAELHYDSRYALQYLDHDDAHAVSLNHPVSFIFDDQGKPGWLRFLDDIMPSGASRKYWVKHLDIEELSIQEQNYTLLKYGTISPIGNLRIKESLPERSDLADSLYFSKDDVKNRASDFLDYAMHQGAIAGGATGAGGEAPKLLLRCSLDEKFKQNRIWIDAYQDDSNYRDLFYLVKYPRGSRSEIDCNILRAEYFYYHELTSMGFETISIDNMTLEEGILYPSLWLPRFDIYVDENQQTQRYAMESVYSVLKKGAGVTLDHEVTIRTLIDKIKASHMVTKQGYLFDEKAFVIEWVRRDLANILFGNSDNHGRNISFLKGNGFIKLAPIYDFAPMKADPEGIPRSTKWKAPLEIGGEYDFVGIAESLSDLVAKEIMLTELKNTANQCVDLKLRLTERGVPLQILQLSSIGFDFICEKLTRWGLL